MQEPLFAAACSMIRKIIHIDMDAFFASVEMRQNPSLATKPIAVGHDGPRGVVATANYEARKYGVHSAMAMARAKQLCPSLTIVPCHFDLYKQVSAQVHEIFHEYTDLVEPLSIDEAFLDVTTNKYGIKMAVDIAREIKSKIRQRTGLTASAGVSYCKFLAKVASDYNKPDGLCVVHPLRALDFIAALPIEDFWGVGPKTAQKLRSLGITNGVQLRDQPLHALISLFGKQGRIYYDFARGIDERPVVVERIRKSVSCEETFATDIFNHDEVHSRLRDLIIDLSERISRKNFTGRTLTLKVKFFDFTQITRSVTAKDPLRGYDDILPLATGLLSIVDYSAERPVRLMGLGVGNHESSMREEKRHVFPTLFDDLEYTAD